jgi:hypothetical protein
MHVTLVQCPTKLMGEKLWKKSSVSEWYKRFKNERIVLLDFIHRLVSQKIEELKI